MVKKLVRHLRETLARWQKDDGNLLAAAVAYYAALSFFPLLLVLMSGLGFALQFTELGQDARRDLLRAISNYASPAVEQNVATMLERVQKNSSVGGPLGMLVLLFTAGGLFVQFERAFDKIWNTRSPEGAGIWGAIKIIIFYRLRAFLLLLALGLLTFVVFVAGVTLESIQRFADEILPVGDLFWRGINVCVSVVLNTGVFTLLYRLLPKVRVRWSEAVRGALLAAVIWEVGRFALTMFLVGEKYSAFGVVGSFIAVMLWIYYASSVVFIGAEYVQVICDDCNPRPDATSIPPAP